MYNEDYEKESIKNESETINNEEENNISVEKTIDETTYQINKETSGYVPGAINNGKISFVNKPKSLVKRPSFFSSNIGPRNQGFAKMAGLGVILAVLVIVVLLIINRM